jgi:hemerythrin
MVLFKWKNDFRIGLEDIDSQHKIFLGYINQCYDAVTREKLTKVPPDLVKKLKKYAEIHFRYEEHIMEFYGFPELEKHQELHRYFVNETSKLEKSRLGAESTTTLKNVLTMMRDWFLNHILIEDKKLAPYV